MVFVCQNNQWAISIPREEQTAAPTLAQKAVAYGFDGVQVDGNDVFAVYRATRTALDKARSGGGPTFIECHTYRMGDHTTADDAARYRPAEEMAAWRARDPILRLERYMVARGLGGAEYADATRARAVIDAAVAEMEAISPPGPELMFTHTRANLSPRQAGQKEGL